MKKYLFIGVIALVVAGFTALTNYPVDPAQIRSAITKSLPLLQQSSHNFLLNAGGCHSCHGQSLGAVTFYMAKEKGFAVQDTILKEALDSIQSTWIRRSKYLAQHEDPTAIVVTGSYDLWAFAENKTPGNKVREMLAVNIMHRQLKDGSWVSPNLRPPMEYYSITATALALKGIQVYIPGVHTAEVKQRVARASVWLKGMIPVTNEEKVFQILGLQWAGENISFINEQVNKLVHAQRRDGGWAQLDSLPSDAYATGQSIYALLKSGKNKSSPEIQKGLDYLLRTQADDGSWHVRTRSFPSVPFTESGFPHGPDQFISAAGSHWATMALIEALE